MTTKPVEVDYYAVLQVHPDADGEVIEAAYRQLMKKHHPDRAGDDLELAAVHHARAKGLNEAYRVLRDPAQRAAYDARRALVGHRVSSSAGSGRGQPTHAGAARAGRAARPQPPEYVPDGLFDPQARFGGRLHKTLGAVSAAYYLLPGTYEWEAGRGQELLIVCLLPILGVLSFALMSGRLAPLIGRSIEATLLAWGVLVLLSLPTWRALPRVAMATAPSLFMLSGSLDLTLRQANVPGWLAWVLLSVLSLVLSARLYVFGVLPMLGLCWVLTRFS